MDIPLDSENYGCTDPSACNYDIIANIDDDTCNYTNCPEAIITFAVNMSYQIEKGNFISGQDILYMVGSFNSWNETNTTLSPIEDDIYEITFSNFSIGDSIIFKFMINNNWESPNPEICIDDGFGGCNRLYTQGFQAASNFLNLISLDISSKRNCKFAKSKFPEINKLDEMFCLLKIPNLL